MQVEYRIEVEQDDQPVRGNALDSGDPDYDKKVEGEIIERLERGDVWAWALVRVVAFVPGYGLEGDDHLGGCTYENEERFKSGGYYPHMIDAARAELFHKIGMMHDLGGLLMDNEELNTLIWSIEKKSPYKVTVIEEKPKASQIYTGGRFRVELKTEHGRDDRLSYLLTPQAVEAYLSGVAEFIGPDS